MFLFMSLAVCGGCRRRPPPKITVAGKAHGYQVAQAQRQILPLTSRLHSRAAHRKVLYYINCIIGREQRLIP